MKNDYILPVIACVVAIVSLAITLYTQQIVKTAQAELANHCATVNAQVITEFDALIAQGKFPTDDQQNTWKRLTEGCKEGQ